ncbi:2-oxo-4-hydroxy-4-carboxy-5-ureidoimidazoline decarboxylase [Streptomyces sp. NPDC005722]
MPRPAPAIRPGLPHGLRRLNDASPGAAEAVLLSCCGSLRWARRVAAHRPYPDLDALLAAADEAAYDLTPADLADALAAEASGAPPDSAPTRGHLAAHTALRAAQAAYEARFGHVFVLSLDGVHPGESLDRMLASLRQRLGNDPDEERVTAAEELRRVTRSRLVRLALGDARGGPGVPGRYTHTCGIDHT